MLWISVYLPMLSLQSHCRGALGQLYDVPLVISDGIASRPHVHATNICARDAGIAVLMPVAAAQARTAELVVVQRDPAKEQAALGQIADWLMQFTPMVCTESAGASLEVSTTLRLFGGIAAIADRIRCGIRDLGFYATVGIAPAPLAAWLLAKASHDLASVRMCRESEQLPERLGDIPLALFGWPDGIMQPLNALGLTRVKDLLKQPRAGLARRFGDVVTRDLDRALAQMPDPRAPIRPAEHFASSIELLFDIIDAERLAIPIGMLLSEMQGFLFARGAAVSEIQLVLKHNRALVTGHRFGARHALRNASDWSKLIRERLDAQPLPEPVTAITLSAVKLVAFQMQNESWLPTSDKRNEKWQALLDRVTSRLGNGKNEGNVFFVQVREDHRPERAWQTCTEHRKRKETGTQNKPRPILLLTEPQALLTMSGKLQHHGALDILAGPERIEAGWWDNCPVARDYFVARNPQHEVCWIFRDYHQDKRWYLHGYFA